MTDLDNATKARRIAVHQIRQLMEFWNIAPDELRQSGALPVVRRPAVVTGFIKYRHPVTGETWDGEGEHPEWLRRALLKEGYRVAELKPELQPPLQQEPPVPEHQAGRGG